MDDVDEGNKMITDSIPGNDTLGKATISMADNAISVEDHDICKKCGLARPPPELISNASMGTLPDTELVWIGCEVCDSWMHAVCVADMLRTKHGITQITEEAIDKIPDGEFVCCDGE